MPFSIHQIKKSLTSNYKVIYHSQINEKDYKTWYDGQNWKSLGYVWAFMLHHAISSIWKQQHVVANRCGYHYDFMSALVPN